MGSGVSGHYLGMTTDLTKCKNCQTWKDTRGRGNKTCLKCNPFREMLQNIKPLDTVPDDVIEQYPDLQSGRIKSILDAISHLSIMDGLLFFQFYFQCTTRREAERFWAKPPCVGFSGQGLRNIAETAKEKIQEILKK
jgi:hypothetical protein